jgi:hypothetical protein
MQISATADPASVNNGQKSNVTVYLSADSAAVAGATVQFTSDNGGKFSATVDQENGYYITTFTAPSFTKETTCTITATAQKMGYITSQVTTQITVQPPPASTSTTTSSTTSTPTATPKPGSTPTPSVSPDQNSSGNGTGTIQLRIQDYSGNPLSDTTVASTSQPQGMRTLAATTNETGLVTFTEVIVGKYFFVIQRDGYEQLNKTINFKGQPMNMTLALSSDGTVASADNTTLTVVIIVVIVLVVLVAGALIVKRRRANKNQLFPSSFKYP